MVMMSQFNISELLEKEVLRTHRTQTKNIPCHKMMKFSILNKVLMPPRRLPVTLLVTMELRPIEVKT